ncbi:Protoporphyrinogen oxidase [Hibiscus syriacus]|uniref:Protoporphyrinogen oxidase n=1 Tax=Hibiscus syriacus TaxID=106335 RepID=A0A6A2ZZ08_HIBSY|nr:Protoporphyrinogen oxidase [Hibiscus syriacus]
MGLSLLRSSTFVSPFSKPNHQLPPRSHKPFKLRCSVAEGPTISASKIDGGESSIADCVIVGGGFSGLCIAQALAKDRIGGNISTVVRDGYLWEEGPNSFQPSDPILTMAVDSGLKDDLVLGDPDAPRFVLWDGILRPVPAKPIDLPFFDLMSIGGKLRAGFGAIGIRPPPPGHEESVEEFVRHNLGAEVFERLIEPFCSGVYAGDPSKLSMKAAFGRVWKLEEIGGSIIGGTFQTIQERNKTPKPPRDPLGRNVKLSWKLSNITKLGSGGYSLTYETPEGIVSLQSRSVVMAIPSHVASNLLHPLSAAAADALIQFYYPPVAQGIETLGTIYSSSLFPNRAPPGRVLLLNYIGGATNPGILSKTEGELVEAFSVGHLDLLDTAKTALRDSGFHGLFLGGNYVSGVALGRCVEGAYKAAAEVEEFLSNYAYN